MQRHVEKFGISGKRGRASTRPDPYLPEAGIKEPAVCQACQAVYRNKGWHLDPLLAGKLAGDPAVHWVTCPGCQKVAAHYAEGVVTLRGDYLWNHEAEIRRIVDNTTARFTSRNPREQVIRMQQSAEAMIIETTDSKLAEHLGRSLRRAHSGELRIDWQGSPVVCRVQWERWH